MMRRLALSLLLGIAASGAIAQLDTIRDPTFNNAPYDQEEVKWIEAEAIFPEFPKPENLLPFYVSEMTSHRFMIDASTLQVGKDRVVRYVMVIQTSGGATNISFEGIRCDTREYRIYASGRKDGSWAKARLSEWRFIENKPVNRHHAELSRNLFCPDGVPIQTSAEGVEALRLGKHPSVAKGSP
ncbi:MAG: CNP1-like family protein [Pseudomonadota bacterium]